MKTVKKLFVLVIFSIVSYTQAQESTFEVEVLGEGQPILLFPGFTCTGDVWSNIVADLSKNYECHIFTFAGFGSVPAIEKPWLSKIRDGVSTYIKEEKLQKPSLIGHSLGGTLALWLASEDDIYDKVIAVDALPSTGALMMPNFKSEYIVYDNPYNEQLLQMSDTDFEKMALQMAQGMTLNESKRDQIKNWMQKADRKTYVYGYTDLLKLDLREQISTIKASVTILGATEPYGLEVVKKTFGEQYKNLKNYTIKFAPKSAHFIMFDQPEWLLNQIKMAL